jgi:carboxyl-terminal processing protease
MAAIDNAKDKAIVDKKVEIESLLTDEILKRYFYREGLYNYQIEHNPEILEAVAVLNDARRYTKILK